MKAINNDNCEAFFLDYFEGNLNADLELELQMFLEHHPEWKQVFEEYGAVDDSEVVLSEDQIEYDAAATLMVTDREEDLVALMEGLLSPKDRRAVEEKIARDAQWAYDYELFKKTQLHADLSIRFPKKKQLKKGAPIIRLMARYGSIAALLTGAFIAVWVFNISDPSQSVAENPVKTTKELQSTPSDLQKMIPKSLDEVEAPVESSPEIAKSRTTAQVLPEKSIEAPVLESPVAVRLDRIPLQPVAEISINTPIATVRNQAESLAQLLPPTADEEPLVAQTEIKNQSTLKMLVSSIGENLLSRVKNISEDKLLIEQKEDSEEEVYTSTFKLGAFEIYRSRSNK